MKVMLILFKQNGTLEDIPKKVKDILVTLPEDAALQIMDDASDTAKVLQAANDADLILICATANDPRAKQLAAASGRKVCVDVDHFEMIDGVLYAVRNIYSTHAEELIPAGKLTATIALPEPQGEEADLTKAKIVFLGGKGLGNKKNYERMEALAKKMGAAAACTRAAVLSGWAGYETIVGVSGQTIHADVVIAFGVSGAGPLMRGMKDVKMLIAVNTDKKAPIFHYAQYGIVEDCMKIMDVLEQKVEEDQT